MSGCGFSLSEGVRMMDSSVAFVLILHGLVGIGIWDWDLDLGGYYLFIHN